MGSGKSFIGSLCLLIAVWLLIGGSDVLAQDWVEPVGHGIQIGLPLSALAITALERDKKGAVQVLTSFAVETVTVLSMKRIINRQRPNGGKYGFPSGHTAVAFMSSTFLWKRYGWHYGVPATALAAFVGYSRAGTDDPVHYYSDVFAGAAIGILTSYLFTSRRADHVSVGMSGSLSSMQLTVKIAM